MTDNEIKDLARRYAKIAAFDGGFVNPDDFEMEYQNALPVIQWLVESHCIVSREKVKEMNVACPEAKSPHIAVPFPSPRASGHINITIKK